MTFYKLIKIFLSLIDCYFRIKMILFEVLTIQSPKVIKKISVQVLMKIVYYIILKNY